MNGVWQSHCTPPRALEHPPPPRLRSTHQQDTQKRKKRTTVCPSGSGARLQLELHRFESGHGLRSGSHADLLKVGKRPRTGRFPTFISRPWFDPRPGRPGATTAHRQTLETFPPTRYAPSAMRAVITAAIWRHTGHLRPSLTHALDAGARGANGSPDVRAGFTV